MPGAVPVISMFLNSQPVNINANKTKQKYFMWFMVYGALI
jgi:hypothetical protein